MEFDPQIKDVTAAWCQAVERYALIPENRLAMDKIAFDHWTLFWRLLVSCVPVSSDDRRLWMRFNAWKKRERDEVRLILESVCQDKRDAYRTYNALMAHARGHAKSIGEIGEFARTFGVSMYEVKSAPPDDVADSDKTVVCEVDAEVLDALKRGDLNEALRVEYCSSGMPRIRLASAIPTIPPPAHVPAISYFCARDDDGAEVGEDEVARTLAQRGR